VLFIAVLTTGGFTKISCFKESKIAAILKEVESGFAQHGY
jgi:hypothetical protein